MRISLATPNNRTTSEPNVIWDIMHVQYIRDRRADFLNTERRSGDGGYGASLGYDSIMRAAKRGGNVRAHVEYLVGAGFSTKVSMVL